MSVLSCSCPSCDVVTSVPLDALLMATPPDDAETGSLAFVCLNCEELVVRKLSAAGLAILVDGGCTPIDAGAGRQGTP